jgi:hypothetical protein
VNRIALPPPSAEQQIKIVRMLRATLRELFPDYHHLMGDDEITEVANRRGWDILAASDELNMILSDRAQEHSIESGDSQLRQSQREQSEFERSQQPAALPETFELPLPPFSLPFPTQSLPPLPSPPHLSLSAAAVLDDEQQSSVSAASNRSARSSRGNRRGRVRHIQSQKE